MGHHEWMRRGFNVSLWVTMSEWEEALMSAGSIWLRSLYLKHTIIMILHYMVKLNTGGYSNYLLNVTGIMHKNCSFIHKTYITSTYIIKKQNLIRHNYMHYVDVWYSFLKHVKSGTNLQLRNDEKWSIKLKSLDSKAIRAGKIHHQLQDKNPSSKAIRHLLRRKHVKV